MRALSKIFLSSTWADLQEHRSALLFTFAKLQKSVEAMEYFGSRPGSPLEECIKAVRRADLYIGVFGTRYGSTDSEGVSITQREYEEAYRQGKTIFIYLLDEARHPVLPKYTDTGETAVRLAAFKRLLMDRHLYSPFSSPTELAVRVCEDLIRHMESVSEMQMSDDTRALPRELPKLLAKVGYALDSQIHVLNVSSLLGADNGHELEIRDAAIEQLIGAGCLAIEISRGNYDILRGILTFDVDLWRLFVCLLQHYGVDAESLADAIKICNDPMQFRLLVKLSGELGLVTCAEAICERMLRGSDLDREFQTLHVQATPVRDVVTQALGAMPLAALPVVEAHVEQAKALQLWRQKRVFETAARAIRRHL